MEQITDNRRKLPCPHQNWIENFQYFGKKAGNIQ